MTSNQPASAEPGRETCPNDDGIINGRKPFTGPPGWYLQYGVPTWFDGKQLVHDNGARVWVHGTLEGPLVVPKPTTPATVELPFAMQPNPQGWDEDGHCRRCGLAGEPETESIEPHECPPGFASADPGRETCPKCGRPFATVEDFHNVTFDGKCRCPADQPRAEPAVGSEAPSGSLGDGWPTPTTPATVELPNEVNFWLRSEGDWAIVVELDGDTLQYSGFREGRTTYGYIDGDTHLPRGGWRKAGGDDGAGLAGKRQHQEAGADEGSDQQPSESKDTAPASVIHELEEMVSAAESDRNAAIRRAESAERTVAAVSMMLGYLNGPVPQATIEMELSARNARLTAAEAELAKVRGHAESLIESSWLLVKEARELQQRAEQQNTALRQQLDDVQAELKNRLCEIAELEVKLDLEQSELTAAQATNEKLREACVASKQWLQSEYTLNDPAALIQKIDEALSQENA